MQGGATALAGAGGPARLLRPFATGYERGGARFVRRVLLAQLSGGLIVGLVGALLTLLYADLSAGDLVIVILFSWLIFVVDAAFAAGPIQRELEPFERWSTDRDPAKARAAWECLADLPFAPLRRRATLFVLVPLWIGWDLVGGSLIGLSGLTFLLFFPGSVLVWVYWVALRFFVMEQLLRPVLADVGSTLPDGGGVPQPRITLVRRLLVAVPAITILAGTVVAGLLGDHTVQTVALGVLASIVVVVTLASWLVALLADSIARPIGDLQAAAERVGSGDLDVRVPVVSVDETGALTRSFNTMVEGLRERERIREAFGTYVDREVAEHILREGTDLAGEEVEVTAMFIDIRDFTGFAERSPAPKVVATLNELFERIVPVIHEHGGHVDKFVGDGLLAVFGAPRRRPDHAQEALAAACEIAGQVADRFQDTLRVGIGLNSGRVVAGNVGGGGRFEFSVIGDVVNVAARVEAATRQTGDTILLAGRTRELLDHRGPELEPREGLELKGKREAVAVYAVVSSS